MSGSATTVQPILSSLFGIPLKVAFVLALLIAAWAGVDATGTALAAGCSPNSDQVAVFVDANYGGACSTKGVGDYPDPGSTGIPNDSLSSFHVGSNVQLVVCRDNNYQGGCSTYTGDVSAYTSGIGNDQMSSMHVQSRNSVSGGCSPNPDQVSIFVDANYGGACSVKGVGDYPDPGSTGIPNDSLSSFHVGSNVQIIVCRDNNYQGGCATYTGDVSAYTWDIGNDQMSSMHVQSRSSGGNGCSSNADQVSVFVDANYGGACSVRGVGDYPDPGSTGIPNDSLSSFHVGANVQLVVCHDNNYQGGCFTYTGDVSAYTSGIGNDQMSSMHVQPRATVPSPCAPTASQVAIFVDANYSGACSVKGVGDYPDPSSTGIPNDSLSSFHVGANVQLVVCRDNNYQGGCSSYTGDFSAYTSGIGNDQMSSMHVQARSSSGNGPGVPSSKRLTVPFQTQLGSADRPGSGSNNCGPASITMAIRYYGGFISVQDAATKIRGSNKDATNKSTDFKGQSLPTLSPFGLTETNVQTLDDVRREIAAGHPVIILVNNFQYRSQSPRPYSSDDNKWFTNAHIVVVTGYDATNVYINDPLRTSADYALPLSVFSSAASTTPQSNTTSWYAASVVHK